MSTSAPGAAARITTQLSTPKNAPLEPPVGIGDPAGVGDNPLRKDVSPALYHAHGDSRVETDDIGAGTRIWAFAHVLAGARVGADCNICDHTFIEGGAVLGNRVTLKCGVQLWAGVTLEDDVFVGPNATFTNDPFPRSRHYPLKYLPTLVRAGASIGANATILPGLTIGARAMVGAGAVVTRDVPPLAIVMGNPAVVTGYVDRWATEGEARLQVRPTDTREIRPGQRVDATRLMSGACLYRLPSISDSRGHLTFGEFRQSLPFAPRRYFLISGVPTREVRGEHAHLELEQFLIAVHGSCSVRLFDGDRSEEVNLDRPDLGLYVPPMVWTTEYKYSRDAVLLVLASDIYREADYIRDIDEYLALVGDKNFSSKSCSEARRETSIDDPENRDTRDDRDTRDTCKTH